MPATSTTRTKGTGSSAPICYSKLSHEQAEANMRRAEKTLFRVTFRKMPVTKPERPPKKDSK